MRILTLCLLACLLITGIPVHADDAMDARVTRLLVDLKDPNENVRLAAVLSLGAIRDARAVTPLIELLSGPEQYSLSCTVQESLVKIGAPAVPALLEALNSQVPIRCLCSVQALGQIRDPRAIQPLIDALMLKNVHVQLAAEESLEKIGAPALDPLIAALRCPQHNGLTVRALGSINDPRVIPPLCETLKDASPWVVQEAARKLGERRVAEAIEPLLATLNHPDTTVRLEAARALACFDDPRVPIALCGLLKDNDRYLSYDVAQLLQRRTDPRNIPALINYLSDMKTNGQAEIALTAIGTPAVEALLPLLHATDACPRQSAAYILWQIGDLHTLPALIGTLKQCNDVHGKVMAAAEGAVRKIGTSVVSPLLKGLRATEPEQRALAARLLATVNDPIVVPSLIKTLGDASPDVRRAAARALGNLHDLRAVEPLIALLKDKKVGAQAADALGKLRDKRAIEPLLALMVHAPEDEGSTVARALGELGDARAAPPILTALRKLLIAHKDDPPTCGCNGGDYVPEMVAAYTYILAKFGVAGVPALITALDDDTLRNPVFETLTKIGDPAVPALIELMHHRNAKVRCEAVYLMQRIKDPHAIDPLLEALHDADIRVRVAAELTLGILEEKRAVDPLIAMLQDRDACIRECAAAALGEIGDKRAIEPLQALKDDPSPMVKMQVQYALRILNGELQDINKSRISRIEFDEE